jgi:hypothetical protein
MRKRMASKGTGALKVGLSLVFDGGKQIVPFGWSLDGEADVIAKFARPGLLYLVDLLDRW